jgi:hypothetical protein
MNEYLRDRVKDGVVSYLRSRAEEEMRITEHSPEASMLSKAADMIVDLTTRLQETKDRLVKLQRLLAEYEAREIEGQA